MANPYFINNKIRKINVGLNQEIVYMVGRNDVTSIIHDKDSLVEFGINKYIILTTKKNEMETPWKVFENMPVGVEYDTQSLQV